MFSGFTSSVVDVGETTIFIRRKDSGRPLGIWRHWAAAVTGYSIAGGHFFPEQNATETFAELHAFFRLDEPGKAVVSGWW